MGTLRTTFGNIGFSVSQGLDYIRSSFSTLLENILGTAQAGMESLVSGDVIGIDSTQIPAMQQAIDTYISDLNDQLATMEESAETSDAYKGQYAAAVSEFIAAIKTCCYNVISQLLAFKDQLTVVGEKYVDNDTSMATDIGTQTSEMSSMYQAYDGAQQ